MGTYYPNRVIPIALKNVLPTMYTINILYGRNVLCWQGWKATRNKLWPDSEPYIALLARATLAQILYTQCYSLESRLSCRVMVFCVDAPSTQLTAKQCA